MKTVLIVFGTRPEAIKMCPLVLELKARAGLRTVVCSTGQHRQMLDGVMRAFGVTADVDLAVMEQGQSLSGLTRRILSGMDEVLEQLGPQLVLVHGDTATAFGCALACFYRKIPIGHVEAGLRTHCMYSPYPEEFYRQAIGLVAEYHFAPTPRAAENLLREGKDSERIFVTGNTVVDALRQTVRPDYSHPVLTGARGGRLLLMTAHRRENLGAPLVRMLHALRRVVEAFFDVQAVYPLHMNPAVQEIARRVLGSHPRIHLLPPLEVVDFHNFLSRSTLVLTDSGGVQEEATALGRPTLVLRDTTERPEGILVGTLQLVGTGEEEIFLACKRLLEDPQAYAAMQGGSSVYGDGFACKRIADILEM